MPANAGDVRVEDLIPGLERFPGEGDGNPLRYSCLENPTDRGAWWATVHGVTKSWTGLKRLRACMCVGLWKAGLGRVNDSVRLDPANLERKSSSFTPTSL